MPYTHCANFMRQLVANNVVDADNKIARLNAPKIPYVPAPDILPGLVLWYPGEKEKGDYLACFYGTPLSHKEFAEALFNHCQNINQAIELNNILLNVYNYGLNANIPANFEISIYDRWYNAIQFKIALFWIIAQEEINYPYGMGVKLPIIRYMEAIIAAFHPELLSLILVKQRIDIKPPLRILEGICDVAPRGADYRLFEPAFSLY